jgi:hypothetical protein
MQDCRKIAFAAGTHFLAGSWRVAKPTLLNLRFLLGFLCSMTDGALGCKWRYLDARRSDGARGRGSFLRNILTFNF